MIYGTTGYYGKETAAQRCVALNCKMMLAIYINRTNAIGYLFELEMHFLMRL